MKAAILCLGLCGPPASVHCHLNGIVDTCYLTPRDSKSHIVKALGLPKDGVVIMGGGTMSWTWTAPIYKRVTQIGRKADEVYTGAPRVVAGIGIVEIDGKAVKVKR